VKQCWVTMQVAEHEEQVTRLQSELDRSVAEAGKQLTAVQKLETEHSTQCDKLNKMKDEVNILSIDVNAFHRSRSCPEIPDIPEILKLS